MSGPAGRISGVSDDRRSSAAKAPRQRAGEHEQLGFDLMPQRLFVCTPSRLSSYEECPRRYRYTYLDRPSPPKGPAWAHNSLGASVHTALRNWWDLPAQRRQPGALPTLLRATWVRDGYRDDEQQRTVFERALRWLESYLLGLDADFEPLAVERTVAAKTAVLALSGRVDRIDQRGDELVIVDYKTGRAGLGPDDARGSLALALYAFAAARVFRKPCRTVELHHLPTGTVAVHEHTESSIARHVRRAEQTAQDVIAAQQSLSDGADPDDTFPAQPSSLCGWCDFRRICPAGAKVAGKEPWAAVEAG